MADIATHEKPEQVRHYEHDEMLERLKLSEKLGTELVEKMSDFIVHQSEFMHGLKAEMLQEIRQLERGISQKTEMDSGIIARQADQEKRLDRMEGMQDDTARTIERTAALVEQIAEKTKSDLKAAHDAIRGHGQRIEKLEKHGGKVAVSAWKYIGASAGSVAVALLIAWATGALRLNP